METVTFYFLVLQNHCRWWLPLWNQKMHSPWKKSNDKPRQCIKKQRHYFAYKGLYSQSYGFSSSHVWMWHLDNKKGWTLKNWCLWTVVLESPLDRKEIKPVNPREINPEYSLERLMLKLKLQHFGHLMRRADSLERPWCWERLKAGGEGDDRGWDGWMATWTQWTWVWANSRRWWRIGKPGVLQFMESQRVGHDWVTEQPYNTFYIVWFGSIFAQSSRKNSWITLSRCYHSKQWGGGVSWGFVNT